MSRAETGGSVQLKTNDLGGLLPDWLHLTGPDIEGVTIEDLVLRIFRRLDTVFPERVNLLEFDDLERKIGDLERIWDWLLEQAVVSGPLTNSSLTLAGCQAFRQVVENAPAAVRDRLHSRESLSGEDARRLMMQLLRCHYEKHLKRGGK